MKNLLAVILLALCALVVTSNSSQAQDQESNLPSWTVEVHGEYGIGLISGASVEILNSNNNVVFSTVISNQYGISAWVVPQGFPSGTYKIHVFPYNSHGEVFKTVSYSSCMFFDTINLGPVL